MTRVELISAATDELLDALARLIPQLKISSPRLTRDVLTALVSSDASTLLAARDDSGQIVGALTLVVYRAPTGVRARIEDVVVDEAARGRGIAVELVRRALEIARQKGADGIALTSNPRRESANRLYQKVGFKKWETNVYFYKFE
ncbi:MAG: GNAT family N-acetyltransferase [Anaerolineales bacterium]|nr:GNAT family N-acetyltransferase [Anaerolineales bacterium]MCZ2289329.1 GNAT family N-acetyltransferase [Anaerolineales bacterium]